MRKILAFFLVFTFCSECLSQSAGVLLSKKIDDWSSRSKSLDSDNPEILSLHCILLEDIIKEMDKEKKLFAEKISADKTADFYALKHNFDVIYQKTTVKNDSFQYKKSKIGDIFFLLAKEDLAFRDTSRALYHLDRALQYQPHHPKSLLETAKIKLATQKYDESVEYIHKVYSQENLSDDVEREVSDFTLVLYEELYSHGDNLVKSGRAAEALEVFYALEHFCNNMPSGYCNDDYYKGLMLSREGVYESYISIAKEAERRGNIEMSKKFYKYAAEYLNKE